MIVNIYHDILDKLNNGMNACIRTSFSKLEGDIHTDLHKEVVVDTNSNVDITKVLEEGIPRFIDKEDKMILFEPFYKEERFIVLGGGHIAIPLVEFATKIGFSVTVIDDRLQFANTVRFPLAKQVICDSFEHALSKLQINETDYVIIITRGHRYDSVCLKTLCEGTEPTYLGMIGSKRRTAIVKEMLVEEGCSVDRLDRVHTPIGLKIGAITPEEIAISILSEVISHKRLGTGNKTGKNASDIDFDVLKALADDTENKKAVITVMETKGSTPRGAGAKMIVYPDGRILGSIGGGCSEAAVTVTARHMIGTGQYKVIHIDLTGEAAEEEGMVCGGIMTVLVEDLSTTEDSN